MARVSVSVDWGSTYIEVQKDFDIVWPTPDEVSNTLDSLVSKVKEALELQS